MEKVELLHKDFVRWEEEGHELEMSQVMQKKEVLNLYEQRCED